MASMPVRARCTQVVTIGDSHHVDEFGFAWELLVCPACIRPSLLETSSTIGGTEHPNPLVVYPLPAASLDGLPHPVRNAYQDALRLMKVDANTFAVAIRRTLEFVCDDRGAQGRSLDAKLRYLADHQKLSGLVGDVARQLRLVGNIGAHACDHEIARDDVPTLLELTEGVIDYVYRIPAKLNALKARLDRSRASS